LGVRSVLPHQENMLVECHGFAGLSLASQTAGDRCRASLRTLWKARKRVLKEREHGKPGSPALADPEFSRTRPSVQPPTGQLTDGACIQIFRREARGRKGE